VKATEPATDSQSAGARDSRRWQAAYARTRSWIVHTRSTDGNDESKVEHVPLSEIQPSPENDRLYRPVDPTAPDIRELAASIRQHGLMEPIVLTLDGWIISGHRRYVACRRAGLREVPVRYVSIWREDDIDAFVVMLREHNRQREKTNAEKLREELVTVDPDEAYQSLIEHREQISEVSAECFEIEGRMHRKTISAAKQPMLAAVRSVLNDRRSFWPLSDRQIHYALLNNPPLKHASKSDSIYDNTKQSYRNLVDLLSRARLAGEVPWNAIADETRPVRTWQTFAGPQRFIRRELADFLSGYWRDLQQSQPNHIEILGEKNTVAPMLKPVAMEYCIPLTIGRGFCSLPPRKELADRYFRSGREKLVLLIAADFDPDGWQIGQSFARSMRDDFGIENIHPIKFALNSEHADRFELPPALPVKKNSPNYKKFVERYGGDGWELEALAPQDLQKLLRETIDSVLDVDAYNAELDVEKRDAAFLQTVRHQVTGMLSSLDIGGDE